MQHSQSHPLAAPEQGAPAQESREASRRAPAWLPELIAPAGDWECARAAVENGADTIYFGLEKFNARMRADNFTEADLPALMEFLHRRGVKGYVTFNILVFENELAEAEQYARTIINAGVDAAVVQDVGLCRLLRRLSPDFPIHVSTQMTVTSAAGIEFARGLGCSRVVLARECSLKEIEALQCPQVAGDESSANCESLPLEVFIHGALCVAYSGQCLTSEALGGRSANRGECAQACRMPYDLIADSKVVDLGDRKYLLSPQDLAGLEVLPELVRMGVAALKIEGRLKSPEYVANITRIYRKALDRLGETQRAAGAETQRPPAPSDGCEQEAGGPPSPPLEERVGERRPVTTFDAGVSDIPAGCCTSISGARTEGGGLLSLALSSRAGEANGDAAGGQRDAGGEQNAHSTAAPDHWSLVSSQDRYEMEMAFSRGLHTGWFRGTNNQQLVHGRFGKKRGVFLGEVARVAGGCVWVKLEAPLKPGDGVVFDAGHPEKEEEGGKVYEVRSAECGARNLESEARRAKPKVQSPKSKVEGGPVMELRFGRRDVDFRRVHVGDKVWKTSDPELDRRLRQSFEGATPRFQRPVQMEVHGLAGKPLTLIVRDELGHVVRLESAMPLARAEKQPLTKERLQEQLGRLGGTAFKLGELKNCLEGEVVLPVSELNRLRREAVRELETLRAQPKKWRLERGGRGAKSEVRSPKSEVRNAEGGIDAGTNPRSALRTPHLIVLVRDFAQLDAALQCGVGTVYCEFEDPKKYREAVTRFRNSALRTPQSEIFVAPPRVFKGGEEWTLKQVRSCEADGYLVRNYDHLGFFAEDRRIGDYSLNIANGLAADYFKCRFGLERVTASYDLNGAQLAALLEAAPPEWFEITIHQHMPMFHMEHCVFCAFLSSGTDYTNCGRPCDTHDLKLRDRVSAEHSVKADAGCRNTVYNALAQTGAEEVSRLIALGARHFRLEFLNEGPEHVAATIAKYRQLLEGQIGGGQVWRELKVLNQLGVTRGQKRG